MSRGIGECPEHGEYHEVGPHYDCPECVEQGEQDVLETYYQLHEGKITAHWLWVAIERIVAGEPESEVMEDYGYVYAPDIDPPAAA